MESRTNFCEPATKQSTNIATLTCNCKNLSLLRKISQITGFLWYVFSCTRTNFNSALCWKIWFKGNPYSSIFYAMLDYIVSANSAKWGHRPTWLDDHELMMNCFVVWLTNERRLALFLAGTVVRDPHIADFWHGASRLWIWTEPEFRLSRMKLCSSDIHYTTVSQKAQSNSKRAQRPKTGTPLWPRLTAGCERC